MRRYDPTATLQQILEFRPGNPETYTASRFLNAALTILNEEKCDFKTIAKKMELPEKEFSGAFFVETRMKPKEFHNYWRAYNIDRAVRETPKIDGDELAWKVGYANRAGVWNFYTGKVYKRIAKELGLRLFREPERQVHHGLRGGRW